MSDAREAEPLTRSEADTQIKLEAAILDLDAHAVALGEDEERSTVHWRTGRKVGRTIYLQRGAELSDDDLLIGMMDTVELAQKVVRAVNAEQGER